MSFSAIVSYIFRRAAEIVSERFMDLIAVRFTDAVSVVSRMSCCVMERFALHEHRAASVAMVNTVLHIAFFMISLSLSSPLFPLSRRYVSDLSFSVEFLRSPRPALSPTRMQPEVSLAVLPRCILMPEKYGTFSTRGKYRPNLGDTDTVTR